MKYEMLSSKISGMVVSEDSKSIQMDITIQYMATGADKTQPSSVGSSFTISLESGERNTMAEELDKKILDWFELNFNG